MRKMWTILLLSCLVMILPVQASGDIIVIANGEPVIFTDQHPINLEGNVMVPVRQVFESLGFAVGWDEASSTATLSDLNNQLSISVGKTSLLINGGELPLEIPAQIIEGRTYLPLRAVSEAVGSEVNWKGESKTADIRYSGAAIKLMVEPVLPVIAYYPDASPVVDFGKLNPTATVQVMKHLGNQLHQNAELRESFIKTGMTESQIEKKWYVEIWLC